MSENSIKNNPFLLTKKNFKKPQAGGAADTKTQAVTIEAPKDEARVGSTGAWGGAGLIIPKTATSGTSKQGLTTNLNAEFTSPEINRFEQAEAELHKPESSKLDIAKKVGLAAGLATVALVGLGTNVAQAQTVATTQTQALTRSTAPVRVSSPQDAVENFSAENQLYVVGNPQMDGHDVNLDSFTEALRDHPNVYVVINGDYVSDLNSTEVDVGHGIGNSQEFMGVREQATGERNGVLFYINLNVNRNDADTGRATMMRSEGLPDQLGVGDGRGGDGFDAWFPNGRPGKLGSKFVNAITQQGKDLGQSMDVVFDEINSTIASHANQVVGQASSQVSQASSALGGAEQAVARFQSEHGRGGELGSPNVDSWRSTVRQAQDALDNKDFGTARQLASSVTSEMRAYESAVADFNQADGIATQVQSVLDQVQGELDGLPDNSQGAQARSQYSAARSHMEKFQASYDAKNTDFNVHLDAARNAANSASSSVEAAHSAESTARNLKLGGAAAVTVAVMAAGIIANRRAAGMSKEAEAELKEATAQIADKSQALLSLMEKADFNTMAGFQGETKKLADQVMDETLTALTLVGGAEKFLAEAETLIKAKGLAGKVKNMFSTGNYKKSLSLLTQEEGGQALKFDTRDASRAAMEEGSKAEGWRDQILDAGQSRQFEATLREVLLKMADSYDSARELHEEIEFKHDRVNVFLKDVTGQAQKSRTDAISLQESGKDDGFFTAPAVTKHLLANVLADEKDGGLLAKGGSMASTDPVQAWDDYGSVAKRMTEDANEAVTVGKEARETLLPTIDKADSILPENGVKTDWAHQQKETLSRNLDELAVTATRTDISEDLQGLRKQTHVLNSRVSTAIEQDHTRREVSPKEISAAKEDVAQTRESVFKELQASGAFRNGSPDGVLREPGRDPSERTEDADENLAAIAGELSQGDIEQAGTHIQNITNLTSDAHRLAQETREALAAYPGTLDERQSRHSNIGKSIAKTYQPSLKRIQSGYAPQVMTQVAKDVGAGETLADNITAAEKKLGEANNLTVNAVKNYDRAYLLTSRDELNKADGVLKSAQGELDAVTGAEAHLAKKQEGVEKSLGDLKNNLRQTQRNAGQHFVRRRAMNFYSDAQKEAREAGKLVEGAVKSPYDAAQQISAAENLRQQAESAIAADKAAYNKAQSGISEADGSISSASSKIRSAESWSDSTYVSGHGTVSTSTGSLSSERSYLSSARGLLRQAQAALDAQDYEEAARLASSADSKADSAYSGAASEISSASSRHSSKVSSARAEVRRKEQAEAAARRRREAAARRSSSSSSSSSFGTSSFGSSSSSFGSSGSFGGSRSSGGSSGSW